MERRVKVTVTAAKNGDFITLSDNSFVAEEGIYSITVLAEDAAGNQEYASLRINVSSGSGGISTGNDGKIDIGLVVGITVSVIAVVVTVAVLLAYRKKNNFGIIFCGNSFSGNIS